MKTNVIVLATRVVSAGEVDRFRDWAERADAAAARIDGHRASVRLEQPGGIFHLVLQFRDRAALAAWESSDAYNALIEEGADFSIRQRQVQEGAQIWFRVPSESSASKPRQVLMTLAAVYPLLLVISVTANALIGDWPLPLRLLLSAAVLTTLLTFVILPRVRRRAQTWLLADEKGEIREA
ncbi:Antibiotic biosynthesis monooxygenase (ABM) superfamily enzyme [Sphingomonas guangdongensis]|uniref:Antibiotic biosynthesis monooxygenase (ABM) superfamily enzyme n=1 Tax=Sphingomonas guangdongensis TaxID=1141890 RepID=A0A285QFJ5_9SPHN|nr:antibiotic biosynthesis monooxygenase [Sphingomonas guangdongensis]SOB80298.1 Antibiotic biosynthesis monooxygenase (ABM) superfamily enzyme [Sphingomonas guangdongensis]